MYLGGCGWRGCVNRIENSYEWPYEEGTMNRKYDNTGRWRVGNQICYSREG